MEHAGNHHPGEPDRGPRGLRRPAGARQRESYWEHVNPIGPRGVCNEAKHYAQASTNSKSKIVHRALLTDDPKVRLSDISLDEQMRGSQRPDVGLHEGLGLTLEHVGSQQLLIGIR